MIFSCPLFLVSDKVYLQHATVALCSILTHFDGEKSLEVFLISPDLEEDDLAPMRDLASIRNFLLHLVRVDASMFENLPDLKGAKSTYVRLMIPELLPEIDAGVYLDSDVIAEDDISPLWECVPGDFAIGAVAENRKLGFICERKKDLSIAEEKDYFNAGVLWMNLKKLRENHFIDKVGDFIKNNPEKIVFHDQDILNFVLRDDWYDLPHCWNVMTDPQNYDDKDYQELLNGQVKILHYAGYLMAPWLYCSKCRRRERYHFYLEKTRFKNYVPPKDFRGIVLKFLPNKAIPKIYRLLKKLHLR